MDISSCPEKEMSRSQGHGSRVIDLTQTPILPPPPKGSRKVRQADVILLEDSPSAQTTCSLQLARSLKPAKSSPAGQPIVCLEVDDEDDGCLALDSGPVTKRLKPTERPRSAAAEGSLQILSKSEAINFKPSVKTQMLELQRKVRQLEAQQAPLPRYWSVKDFAQAELHSVRRFVVELSAPVRMVSDQLHAHLSDPGVSSSRHTTECLFEAPCRALAMSSPSPVASSPT